MTLRVDRSRFLSRPIDMNEWRDRAVGRSRLGDRNGRISDIPRIANAGSDEGTALELTRHKIAISAEAMSVELLILSLRKCAD